MIADFYVCFSLDTGRIEAIFKNDGDALDFKKQYPQAVNDPQPFRLTYDMVPVVIPFTEVQGVRYIKIPKEYLKEPEHET